MSGLVFHGCLYKPVDDLFKFECCWTVDLFLKDSEGWILRSQVPRLCVFLCSTNNSVETESANINDWLPTQHRRSQDIKYHSSVRQNMFLKLNQVLKYIAKPICLGKDN